jgi:hypothetical protein
MNSSFYFLDRGTHVKIVLLAALFASAVVAVGESAQFGSSAHPAAAAMPGQAVRSPKTLSGPIAKPAAQSAAKPEAKQPVMRSPEAA